MPSFRSKRGKRGRRVSYPIISRIKPTQLITKPRTMKFDFFSDPSHGWVKVPKALLANLGIANQISRWSYMRNGYAYLEEDSDATKFVNALQAKGIGVEWRSHIADKQSKIRKYEPYRTEGTLGGHEESPRERWAKYPLPSEAIETQTYKERYDYYIRQGDISAAANEKAINDAIRVLREARLKLLSGGE